MRVEITAIRDAGNLERERVVLKVLAKTDIGRYLLAHTKSLQSANMSVSAELRHVFWIPDAAVEAGDFVTVYTKSGADGKAQNRSGSNTHMFYRGLHAAIWGDQDTPIVLEIADWKIK